MRLIMWCQIIWNNHDEIDESADAEVDGVGATPTGDAPTTFECSTCILPTKVRFILGIWRYLLV